MRSSQPGRGRPRREGADTEILTATIAVVAEVGIAGLTIDAVAARAGVGKATIYRRWPSKEQLLLDAWTSTVAPLTTPDTGNLRDDLTALMTPMASPALGSVTMRRVFPQMIAAARVDPHVGPAYRAFIAERRRPMRAVLERAVGRGELPRSADVALLQDLLIAPLVYRMTVTDEPVDRAVVDGIIDHVLRAAEGIDAR